MKLLTIIFLISSSFAYAQLPTPPEIIAHFRVNGGIEQVLNPGQPTTVEIWFSDNQTGKVYTDLLKVDGKYMHMMIIKDDLSIIKNVYPYYDATNGRFLITLNMPLEDQDNQNTAQTLFIPGSYRIVADIESQSVGLRTAHIPIFIQGEYESKPLELDPVDGDFSVTKFFKQEDTEYKVRMSHSIIVGCFGFIVDFEVLISEKNDAGDFVAINNITPWLERGAHSVLTSEGLYNQFNELHYLRIAADLPLEPGKLFFRFNDRNMLKQGIQKIWFKLKQEDKFLTFPFVFEYYPPLEEGNTSPDCNNKQSMHTDYLHF